MPVEIQDRGHLISIIMVVRDFLDELLFLKSKAKQPVNNDSIFFTCRVDKEGIFFVIRVVISMTNLFFFDPTNFSR